MEPKTKKSKTDAPEQFREMAKKALHNPRKLLRK